MTNYFKMEELECKCGCKQNLISKTLVDKLNKARDIAGIPFIINSGYRCEEHNKQVGGSPTSSHLLGLAVDIKATTSNQRFTITNSLIKAGFNRLGIAGTFIHCDIDNSKSNNVIWTY